ncbi:MAG: PD40 domain-containing protein [Acidobacteriia bacterium]|nr:PD40 domain-containing protein [Terriglobia bacterium]
MGFSPDGRYIAYDFPPKEDAPERDIFVLAADGSRETLLIQHPADDRLLGWTADGTHILFSSDRTGTPSAWLIKVSADRPNGQPVLVTAKQTGSARGSSVIGAQ